MDNNKTAKWSAESVVLGVPTGNRSDADSANSLDIDSAAVAYVPESQKLGYSNKPRLVVITGMSGAGRRTTAHVMEDLGWFVVDNLPPVMVANLVDTMVSSGLDRVAVGLDVRSRGLFEQLPTVFSQLHSAEIEPEVLFLEASDEAIIRRQESSRRPLPLQGEGRLADALVKERRMMSELRASADVVIDTTDLTVHQLAQRVTHIYAKVTQSPLSLQVLSFGFKNGVPVDADLVFDVRFLPNPYWVVELRPKTGLSPAVSDYVLAQPGAKTFLDQLEGLFDTMTPGYIREGKRQVMIAIGCTGGKHRSTAISEALAKRMRDKGVQVNVLHRDLGRE